MCLLFYYLTSRRSSQLKVSQVFGPFEFLCRVQRLLELNSETPSPHTFLYLWFAHFSSVFVARLTRPNGAVVYKINRVIGVQIGRFLRFKPTRRWPDFAFGDVPMPLIGLP